MLQMCYLFNVSLHELARAYLLRSDWFKLQAYNVCLLFWFSFLGDTMRQRIKFTDERVCKSHLLDSCPHDILSGTVSIMFICKVEGSMLSLGLEVTH